MIIVGGGLSGMTVAHEIHKQNGNFPTSSSGKDTLQHAKWALLEAQSVVGGRLKNSVRDEIDLGGAWIWPRYQPHISKLVADLDIPMFLQPDDPSSIRIVGGAYQIVDHLQGALPKENILTNVAVTSCTKIVDNQGGENKTLVRLETITPAATNGDHDQTGKSFFARRVVFACPPKLIYLHVTFEPPLSSEKQAAMNASQTWMAGVTKVALIYPSAFWKDNGGASNMGLPRNRGPAFQVYDASTHDGSVSALTFFTLVPQDSPAINDDKLLADQCADQLKYTWSAMRLPELANKAKAFQHSFVQRWPIVRYISENNKPQRINPHPSPMPALSKHDWDGALLFAGSESDSSDPGVMEGAVGSALNVMNILKK